LTVIIRHRPNPAFIKNKPVIKFDADVYKANTKAIVKMPAAPSKILRSMPILSKAEMVTKIKIP
jgi:hypothetical protein